MTPDDEWVWWCKQRDGSIVEHVARQMSGHTGCVYCVPIHQVEESK